MESGTGTSVSSGTEIEKAGTLLTETGLETGTETVRHRLRHGFRHGHWRGLWSKSHFINHRRGLQSTVGP